MLRASSGKHARLVRVCAAGGDSVPLHPLHPRIYFFWRDLDRGNAVSTSPKTTPKSIYHSTFWCFDLVWIAGHNFSLTAFQLKGSSRG